MFWANSAGHSYTELLPTLQEPRIPAFFDHHVPKDDPEKYLRSVHGDVLGVCAVSGRSCWLEVLHAAPQLDPDLGQAGSARRSE